MLATSIAFWSRDELGIRLEAGMDEVSLELVVDAWSRTYRSKAVTFAASRSVVETRHDIRIIPDRRGKERPENPRVSIVSGQPPADALDHALDAITARYGKRAGNVVAMQLECPRQATHR